MRIYLAARYSRHAEMKALAEELENMGHWVTSRWIRGHHQLEDHLVGTEEGLAKQLSFAEDDVADIHGADCLVAFAEPPRTASRGGRHVEFGMAFAFGLRIIKVGGHETVFDALLEVEHVLDTAALLARLSYTE